VRITEGGEGKIFAHLIGNGGGGDTFLKRGPSLHKGRVCDVVDWDKRGVRCPGGGNREEKNHAYSRRNQRYEQRGERETAFFNLRMKV